MVKYHAAALDVIFAALADPTRRAILARLAQGETSVGEIGRPFAMSGPAVTKHLKTLEAAGLLKRRRDGRVHRCRLDAAPLAGAAEWIESYRRMWEGAFDRLDAYLATLPEPPQPKEDLTDGKSKRRPRRA